MNKIRIYNDNEIKKLMNNLNVECIKNKCQIVYKNKFKLWAVKEKLNNEEKTAREIFEEGGFDMKILDERTPQKRLSSWIKKYKAYGEDYFNNNKNTYKSKVNNNNKKYKYKFLNDPKFVALIIEKQPDGTLKSRIIRKV